MNIKTRLNYLITVIVANAIGINGAYADQAFNYTYNAQNLLWKIDGPRSDVLDVTTYGYNADGTKSSETNAVGHVVTFNQYDSMGQLLQSTDPNGVKTVYTYYPRGWLESVTIKHPAGNTALDSVTRYYYDNIGQLTQITLPNGDATHYEYSDAKQLKAVYNDAGERIEYTLDAAGNRTGETIKNSAGNIKFILARTFDELSRVTDVTGNHSQNIHTEYDLNNNPNRTTNGNQYVIVQQHDALDRVKKVIDPALKETQYTYDELGNTRTVTDARNHVTTYEYDAYSNLKILTSPDTGITNFTEYDDAGNLLAKVDARGIETRYIYDAINRVTQVQYPANPAENITYTYDGTAYGNRGKGRLTKIQDISGTTDYFYASIGRLYEKGVVIKGKSYLVKYTYDRGGQVNQITYPSGRLVNYQRDAQGRITGITTRLNANAVEQTLISSGQYMPFGPLHKVTYGNGITQTTTYDSDYRAERIQTQGPFAVLDFIFGYDNADNILSLQNGITPAQTQGITYDPLNRVKTAISNYGAISFLYDEVGNRLEKLLTVGTNTTKETCIIDTNNNRLKNVNVTVNGNAAASRSFTYDEAGNLKAGTLTGLAAVLGTNNANRTNSISLGTKQLNLTYNALGLRAQKSVTQGGVTNSENYIYDEEGHLLAVMTPTGEVLDEIIYLNDKPVATYLAVSNAITLSLNTPDAVPNPADIIVLTGAVQGGNGTLVEYRYRLRTPDGSWTTVRDWSGSGAYSWTVPTTLGNYTWELSARNYGNTNVATVTASTQVAAPLQQTTQLSSNQLAPGASYTLSSTATGGIAGGDYRYRIRLKGPSTGNAWVVLRDWTTNTSWTSNIPTTTGSYSLETSVLQYNTNANLATVILPLMVTSTPTATPSNGSASTNQIGTISLMGSATGTGTLDREMFSVHTDHLGTPRALTNSLGKAVWNWHSQPFGESAPNQDADGNSSQVVFNLRFPGQYYDAETGLLQNYFRDYDYLSGRYVQSDPIGIKGGINSYVYAEGNPFKYTDPKGLASFPNNPQNTPDDKPQKCNLEDCAEQRRHCNIVCDRAELDFNQTHVFAGSRSNCMKSCLSPHCGGF